MTPIALIALCFGVILGMLIGIVVISLCIAGKSEEEVPIQNKINIVKHEFRIAEPKDEDPKDNS